MNDFTNDLNECLTTLSGGGIILYPTDTVWGLGCDATNIEAVQKLIRLKGKENNQGIIILLASEKDILKYVTQVDLEVFDYLKTVEKPTTVIYQGGTGVADEVLAADGSIAIRLVGEDFCRHLLKRFRRPLVSTSANFHGNPTPRNFSEIDDHLKRRVDYIVNYHRNDFSSPVPSSIIKWRSGEKPDIIRA